jgi:uncharacterized protein with ParB-like and HNH nuclease domain
MEKKTLSNLFEGKLFQTPHHQRGYAWEEKQLNNFVQDIDIIIDNKVVNHYTGTIVIYQPAIRPTEIYGMKRFEIVDIVDGYQRLTTCSLYLSVIFRELIKAGKTEFEREIIYFLKNGAKSKLKLNNDTSDFYYDLINTGIPKIKAKTVHQKRLQEGYNYLQSHITKKIEEKHSEANDYLLCLYDAIIRKLKFSIYIIEIESEIGTTNNLLNSRW